MSCSVDIPGRPAFFLKGIGGVVLEEREVGVGNGRSGGRGNCN